MHTGSEKAASGEKCFRTSIGGQALIEGIMMRGPEKQSITVRRPDGTTVTKTEPLKKHAKIWKLPFLRGVIGFGGALFGGVAALFYSADVAFDEEEDTEPGWLEKKLGKKTADGIAMAFAGLLGVLIPVALFFVLPTFLAGLAAPYIGSGFLRNLLEGLIRICIFMVYMFGMTKMKDIRRTFEYHGAEHKSIHCYENGLPLTVENIRSFPKEHPRCGTSFLFVVMIVSILVFAFVKWSNPFLRVALRLVLLPVVVAVSYEINRIVGRNDNALTRILRVPGLWLQKLTTFEPDDGMIEVAAEALEQVIPEGGTDRW